MLDRPQQQPPCNVAAEQALLGSILIDNAVIDRVAGAVEAGDFSDGVHAHIFGIMCAERSAGRPVSPLSLKPFVADYPDISAGMPVAKYIAHLGVEAPTTMNALAYAETVRDYSARRKLFSLGLDLMHISSNPEATVQSMASGAVVALDDVLSITRGKRRSVSIGEAMSEAINRALNDDGSSRITTGLKDLDKVLSGGWRRKQYTLVAGRPSMGKTTLATSLMLRTAKAGHGVFMLSLEMPAEQLGDRAIADLAYTSSRRLQYSAIDANMSDNDVSMIAEASRQYRQLPVMVDDQRGLTIAEIGSRIRAQQQAFARDGITLGLVVIDHLGFIRASERYRGNRVHEVTEISAGLGQIAKDLDIALVVLCQLNRGTEGRENKRPTLADLRDSGSLEQDADVVIFTFRESYYLERMRCDAGSQEELQRQTDLEACNNTMELLVSKNRNGPTTTVTAFCDMGSNVVRDLG